MYQRSLTARLSDQRLGNWSTWSPEPYTCFTMHTPACEQVIIRGHLPYHPMLTGRGLRRFEANHPTDARVSVLAQGRRLDARILDINI